MSQQSPSLARILVPLAMIVIGVAVAAAVFVNSAQKKPANTPDPAAQTDATQAAGNEQPAEDSADSEQPSGKPPTEPPGDADPEPEPETTPEQPAPEPATPEATLGAAPAEYRVRLHDTSNPATLGGIERGGEDRLLIEFSTRDAGVASIRLADYFDTVQQLVKDRQEPGSLPEDAHVEVQRLLRADTPYGERLRAPFGVQGVYIDGRNTYDEFVWLNGWDEDTQSWGRSAWRETAPGVFEAVVELDSEPVLSLTRTYTLEPGTFDITVTQRIENLSDAAHSVRLLELGPVDLDRDTTGYGGDKRRLRFGYIEQDQRRRSVVQSTKFLWRRAKALDKKSKQTGQYEGEHTVWPNTVSVDKNYDLSWAALTSRYFGVSVLPAIDPANPPPDTELPGVESVDRVLLDTVSGEDMALRLKRGPVTIAPGAAHESRHAIYAGPLSRGTMSPRDRAAGLDGLIVYNFGGPCAICTFQAITGLLFWLLSTLHDSVVFDWALAIIVLVVVVRTVLHPVTRWSQVRMARFGKQMQRMGPKMQKVKEKYADDPKRQQAEVQKLWREEGISPAGFLGCLPMFLQTPVWIALYATLFFAIELRHQPAFFGLFQNLGGWAFLSDLASPDSAVPLGTSFSIPLISGLMGPISSINLLPVLLGVVFFLHQKYLTPETSAAMTPEQEQQQKIIRVMMVVMFPFMMYNAPSGLALYFITNSTLAIFETRWIRKSAEAKGLLDIDKPKTPRQGFLAKRLARLQEIAEQQQRLKEMQGNTPGSSKRKQVRAGRDFEKNKQYKKRK